MKRFYITFLAIVACSFLTYGQVEITNAIFPAKGDSLKYGIDVSYKDFDPEVKGAGKLWDFTFLQTQGTNLQVFLDAGSGANTAAYPDAELVRVSTIGQDIYYKSDATKMYEVGRAGLDPLFGAVEIEVAVTDEPIYRKAPIKYNDTYDNEYGFELEIPVTSLPDSIQAIFAGLVSDVKVNIRFQEAVTADAWGKLAIPDGNFDVLRLHRLTTRTTEVFVKFLGTYVALADLPVTIPPEISEVIKPETYSNYIFLSNDAKEEIVNVATDSTGITGVTFKVNEILTSTSQPKKVDRTFSTFPNPSYGDVTFEFGDSANDQYRVEVYDVLGRKVWSDTTRSSQRSLRADLTGLRRGMYLYRIYNSKGLKLATKRLLIVRP